MAILEHELLCVDSENACYAKSERELCYSLLSNSSLLPKASLKRENIIELKKSSLEVIIVKVAKDEDSDNELPNSFVVKTVAPYDNLEPLRKKVLAHLKQIGFKDIYILKDDVSSSIAEGIYPLLYKVENTLRKYLQKYFVTKFGPDWWGLTADAEMKKKAQNRQNNETNFDADKKAFYVDFGELGKMVYALSSGYQSKHDIYSKIMELEETQDAIAALKMELQTNYNKFFKESFKDKGFQEKWENLEKIRHKVAHNSLFSEEDSVTAKSTCNDVLEIIQNADKNIDSIKFSVDERDAILERIIKSSSLQKITEDEMITRLIRSFMWAKNESADGFLGLKTFVLNSLGRAGFEYSHSYDLIDELAKNGYIEIYDHQGEGHSNPVAAIRLLQKIYDRKKGLVRISEHL